jgi:aerobic C4-dicarboxylate transport protein
MDILGNTFVQIIKWFIGPVIFLTIVLGIAGMESLGKVGRIGFKAILYFEVVTTLALVIGVVVANVIQPGRINKAGLIAQDSSKYTQNTSTGIDWGKFFMSNMTLQVLILSIITGILLAVFGRPDGIMKGLKKLSAWVFTGLKWVMYLAPIGAFGGMAYTVGKFGLHTLIPLAS